MASNSVICPVRNLHSGCRTSSPPGVCIVKRSVQGLDSRKADIRVSFTVNPEEEDADVCHHSPPASTLEPYINPPHHLVSLSSELPSSLPSPHFRCASRLHQFALVPSGWSYASVREMNVDLGRFSLTSSPRLLFWAAVHGHLYVTL